MVKCNQLKCTEKITSIVVTPVQGIKITDAELNRNYQFMIQAYPRVNELEIWYFGNNFAFNKKLNNE